MNVNPTDLLPLQLWLAEQLPEEIKIMEAVGQFPTYFRWLQCESEETFMPYPVVTPREWDYVVRRVEEKLTED